VLWGFEATVSVETRAFKLIWIHCYWLVE